MIDHLLLQCIFQVRNATQDNGGRKKEFTGEVRRVSFFFSLFIRIGNRKTSFDLIFTEPQVYVKTYTYL